MLLLDSAPNRPSWTGLSRAADRGHDANSPARPARQDAESLPHAATPALVLAAGGDRAGDQPFEARLPAGPLLPQGQRGRQLECDAGRGGVESAQVAAGGFIVPVAAAPGEAASARLLTIRIPTYSRLEQLAFFRDDESKCPGEYRAATFLVVRSAQVFDERIKPGFCEHAVELGVEGMAGTVRQLCRGDEKFPLPWFASSQCHAHGGRAG